MAERTLRRFTSMTGAERTLEQREMRAFGAAMRTARRELGYSQKELAGALGVTQPTVSSCEHGYVRPSPSLRAEIVSILGIDEHDLVGARASLRATPPAEPTQETTE